MKDALVRTLDRTGVGPFLRPLARAYRRTCQRIGLGTAAMVAPRRIDRYLAETPSPRLHLGASHRSIPGWLNTDILIASDDIVYLDGAKPFPVRSQSFDYAFCEHFIEHLSQDDGEACLSEVHRCLRPGGIFRIATPDLGQFIGLFSQGRSPEQERYLAQIARLLGLRDLTPCKALNVVMRSWGHQYVYAQPDLEAALRAAGFSGIVRVDVGQSRHPALRGLERHQEFAGEEANRFETMVFEAAR